MRPARRGFRLPGLRAAGGAPAGGVLAGAAVVIVHDPADAAWAAALAAALRPRLAEPAWTASSPREAVVAADDAEAAGVFGTVVVGVVVVSEALAENATLVEAAADEMHNALVPVVVDAGMALQKSWQGELSRSMANEVVFDFREPETAEVADLVRLVQLKAEGRLPDQNWDVFVSHEWAAHAEAREVAARLERDHGLSVWLDEEQLCGFDIIMSRGIDISKVFLVLATEEYMESVNSGNRADNCLKEFMHAGSQHSNRIVVAVLDAEMSKAATAWCGQFQIGLARQTPLDLTGVTEEAIKKLANLIRVRIETSEAYADLSPRMRDLYANLNPCSSELRAKGKAAKFTVGTRSWILDEMGSKSKRSPVSFLVGDDGVGKSVIMAEICSRSGSFPDAIKTATYAASVQERRNVCWFWPRCDANERLASRRPAVMSVAAYHFFCRNDPMTVPAMEALVSIAWQLCMNVPGFADEFGQMSLASLNEKTLADFFQSLLLGPLQRLGSNRARQVVILDALDECSESDALLDKVIRPWKGTMPSWLSLVVSTRSDDGIVRSLNNNSMDQTVLKLRDEKNLQDIERYVEHLLQDMNDVVEQSNPKAVARILAGRSGGLFLWAGHLPDILREAKEAKGDGSLLTEADIENEAVIPPPSAVYFRNNS